ncbi:uncharacterized protein K452DRAFT_246152 [Aplosporella prunicola CBS 121167]|uniref:Maintenance of telomere capping protein 1 n=1 Tax=Aplosporella prunicola CBS 121167 TaxID=1176127 RepID=A0A6A6BK55_9PEZI|nr:uncharacterized protein K452DRAFT_246152 [Aplosporella prunicola CBS 121167]KAF2144028.1 hypothetical protein K452DRAFT_246152 [Aplosporella prunicola CBS 121167]
MAKALSKEELLAQFDDLGDDDAPQTTAAPPPAAAPSTTAAADTEDDPVAELAALAQARPSRPNTPKVSSSSGASNNRSPGRATPSSTASARTSEDKGPRQHNLPRRSGESSRPFHQSFTPANEPVPEKEPEPAASGGGNWSWGSWGSSIIGTASAAVQQAQQRAEAAVKEIQKNEEAQRWAEQVKGNVGVLRSYGDELRSRALPTFTSLLHTLAPPISQHERLQIHITHDLHNYPSLDPTIYAVFQRVMSQVEGGDLLVIQRGSESQQRRASDASGAGGATASSTANTAAWSDGPWWRDVAGKRDVGAVKGLVEGTKLCRASAESYAHDFFASRGGIEHAAERATQALDESNPVRSSDIFLALQAVAHSGGADEGFFGGAGAAAAAAASSAPAGSTAVEEPADADAAPDALVCFAVFLHDPVHSISFHALSQSVPRQWIDWLDASADEGAGLPAAIAAIVDAGGVDPREWVAEWLEEALSLAVGVVAQRYVARRMGVGEGGIGRGKARARERVEESGGGEVARAI